MVVLFATRSPVWPAIAAAHSVEKKIQIHDAVCFVSNNEKSLITHMSTVSSEHDSWCESIDFVSPFQFGSSMGAHQMVKIVNNKKTLTQFKLFPRKVINN